MSHHRAGQLAQAEALYSQILTRDANHADSLHLLGVLYHQSGQWPQAQESIGKALNINPTTPSYHNSLANLLKDQGLLEKAIAHYRRAIELQPDYVEAYNNLANVLHMQGHLPIAVAIYEQAIAIKPDYAAAYNNLGNALHQLGKPDQAALRYEQALVLDPSLAEAHVSVANILQTQGKLDEAIRCYEQAIKSRPDYAQAHNNLGNILKEKGLTDAAMAQYTQAIALKPDYADAYNNIANIFNDKDMLADAAAHYELALTHNPNLEDAHYNLGNIFKGQEKHETALLHYQRCLALNPTDSMGVGLLIAALQSGPLPERASEPHLQKIYQHRAHSWDTKPYQGHKLVAAAFDTHYPQATALTVLDAGCGTGLAGPLLRKKAQRLEGVDFSQAMLDKAKEKDVYDALWHDDLISFCNRHPATYDTIICAATLIHFGDLHPVFTAMATALRHDGHVIATLFPNEDKNNVAPAASDNLAQGGCYMHGHHYITKAAQDCGFALKELTTQIHEYNKGKPIMGFVLVMCKN